MPSSYDAVNPDQKRTQVGNEVIAVRNALQAAKFTKALQEALPRGRDYKQMVRGMATAMQVNPQLYRCTPESLQLSAIQAAQYGFDMAPQMGECYLVPFKDNRKGVTTCTLIPGYKGLIRLALNNPKVANIRPIVAYKNDGFEYTEGLTPTIKHIPAKGSRGPSTHFYCVIDLVGGAKSFRVMSKEECLDHGKAHSRTFNMAGSKWKDPQTQDAMCMKTVIRQALKYVPMSASDPLARAITDDPDDQALDVDAEPLFGGEDEDTPMGDEPLPLNREYLKQQIERALREIPPSDRANVVVPANLDECTPNEMAGILASLQACAA